jgi:hypothetical protein
LAQIQPCEFYLPGPLNAPSAIYSKPVLYGAFVWAPNSQNRRLPARAAAGAQDPAGVGAIFGTVAMHALLSGDRSPGRQSRSDAA